MVFLLHLGENLKNQTTTVLFQTLFLITGNELFSTQKFQIIENNL